MKARIVDGVKLVEVEPGAPLPPGVPSWAERCDVVEKPELSPALKPWVIGAGAAGTLGSLVTLAFFSHWGIAPLLPSLVVLYYGWVPGTTTSVVPSQGGRYLGFEPVAEAADSADAGLWRGMRFVLGAALIVVAVGMAFATEPDWMMISVVGMFGFYLLYHGVTGVDLRRAAPEAPSSLRFRALADPSRPLTADDLHLPDARPAETGSGGEPRPGS